MSIEAFYDNFYGTVRGTYPNHMKRPPIFFVGYNVNVNADSGLR